MAPAAAEPEVAAAVRDCACSAAAGEFRSRNRRRCEVLRGRASVAAAAAVVLAVHLLTVTGATASSEYNIDVPDVIDHADHWKGN